MAADSHKWNRNSNIFDAPSADDSVELMVVAAIATISNFNDFTIELVKLTGWSRTEAYVRQMHATVCREMRLIRKLAAITGISVDINRYIALMGARSVLDGMFVVEVAVVCDAVVTDAVVA